MKKMFRFMILVFGILCFYPHSQIKAEDSNLLMNGNAEDQMEGWTDPDNLWYTAKEVVPIEGSAYFYPGKGKNNSSFIYQDVSLTDYQDGTWVELSGWMANWDQTPCDEAVLRLEFIDAQGDVLEQYARSQRYPQWLHYSIRTQIPLGAEVARIKLLANHYVGHDTDAYFDDLCFQVEATDSRQVFINGSADTAMDGDIIQLTADNGTTTDPSSYLWSSSDNKIAFVSTEGIVSFYGGFFDEVTIYAKDVISGVSGEFYINSEKQNINPVPDQISGLKKSKVSKSTVTLEWSAEGKAEGFYVYQYIPAKKQWILIDTLQSQESSNTVTIDELNAGTTYKFKVKAFRNFNNCEYIGRDSKILAVKTTK